MLKNTDRRGRGECNNVTAYTYGAGRVFYALSSASSYWQKSDIGASLSAKWTNEAVSILRLLDMQEMQERLNARDHVLKSLIDTH